MIERRAKGEALPVNVSQVDASQARQYTDNVQPYTTYEYRIVAHTSAGGTPGPYSNITTGEGGKATTDFFQTLTDLNLHFQICNKMSRLYTSFVGLHLEQLERYLWQVTQARTGIYS